MKANRVLVVAAAAAGVFFLGFERILVNGLSGTTKLAVSSNATGVTTETTTAAAKVAFLLIPTFPIFSTGDGRHGGGVVLFFGYFFLM